MIIKSIIAAATLVLVSNISGANANGILELPTQWRLENYASNHSIVIYFSSAADCPTGIRTNYLTQDDRNRLWSLVMTAKLAARQVGVFYEPPGEHCKITSFFMDAK